MNKIPCAACIHFRPQYRAGQRSERMMTFAICAARSESQPAHATAVEGVPQVSEGLAKPTLVRRTGTVSNCTQAIAQPSAVPPKKGGR